MLSKGKKDGDGTTLPDLAALCDMTPEKVAKLEKQLQEKYNNSLSSDQIAQLVASRAPKSRAQYRVDATRGMTGGKRVSIKRLTTAAFMGKGSAKVAPMDDPNKKHTLVLAFDSEKYVVMESIGTFEVGVELIGLGPDAEKFVRKSAVTVEYASRDGSAKAPDDYKAVTGVLEFPPGETKKNITLTIENDEGMENDEDFFVDLQWPKIKDDDNTFEVALPVATTTITILDDDNPGTLSFEHSKVSVTEGAQETFVEVAINRKGGCKGNISMKYKTVDDTAMAEKDYEQLDGTLEMSNGQSTASLRAKIISQGRYETSEIFSVEIFEATGGAIFDKHTDGGSEKCVCNIEIKPSDEYKGKIDDLVAKLAINYDKIQTGHSSYKAQFTDAVFLGGDGDEKPGVVGMIIHFLTMPWKLLFATIPPTDYCDGWLCFFCALVVIGFVTTLISDLASLLGCVMGLPDAITAITFVALGTSLPDTFASKKAAEEDEYADASIGNVTGSNSVNVFLGIGLSWMAGSFYWMSKERDDDWSKKYPDISADHNHKPVFVVIGGDLGKSVIVFCTCAVICLGTLVLRRKLFGGELGGPAGPKWGTFSFFVFLWLIYIGLSSYFCMVTLADDPCW
jgi:solute carrier family 8 (sodium/calcium exchanger)